MAENGAHDTLNGAAAAAATMDVGTSSTKLSPDAPLEPYMSLTEIAQLNPDSNIKEDHIEKSGGLSSTEATKRLQVHGKNMLTPPPKTPEWKLLLKQFQNMFLTLLNVSGALSVAAYFLLEDITLLWLGIVLFVVVFLTGYTQYHEESKAGKIIDTFSNMLAKQTTVYRDGKQQEVNVEVLVPGDLVVLKNGDKVPADMVLLLCRGLKTECASLTGESEPVSCTDRTSKPGTRPFECKNMAFNSSLCFDGTAVGLVLKTGDKTAIGAIAKMASDTAFRPSPLQKEVANFVGLIAIIAVSMGLVCFITSVFLQGADTFDEIAVLFVNGFLIIMVANVPQGLPTTVVSLLSLAARSMAQKSVLVKRLDCVETLGSTSIICSDKTGTLTKNEMTVTDIWYNERLVKRHRWEAKELSSTEPQSLLYRTAILCNRGEPISDEEQGTMTDSIRAAQRQRISNVSKLSWRNSVQQSVMNMKELSLPKFGGNPSDVALLTYCDRMHSVVSVRQDYPILFEVPFNSTNKWQLVIVRTLNSTPSAEASNDVEYEVLMKGAPEKILNRCATYATTSGEKNQLPVTDAFRNKFTATYEEFAAQGRRVLALCATRFRGPNNMEFAIAEDGSYNFPTTDLNFIGLTAIMDPPRDNVPDAVDKCVRAGVKVFMVTGDHPLTAKAIAKQVGLLKSDNNIELLEDKTYTGDWKACDGAVIHGCRVEELTDDQWRLVLAKPGVCFARTTPAHKLLIVQKCQTLLHAIVAVTGDGVNDAPALKQADVGVAMGLNGSAVAQDSADILLMDDNFASIVDAIEEGRKIFENIKKTIAYTMAHIFPEVVSAVLSLLCGLPAGLTGLQVVSIDLFTEIGPAVSLAYEQAEADLMDRLPRDPLKDRLVSPVLLWYSYVTSGFIITIGCMMAYMFQYDLNGLSLADFHKPDIDEGGFFSLTAEESVRSASGRVYTVDEQKRIFSEGVTAFYIALTTAQFCHIWVCKTRTSSLFTHGFGNKLTFYGVAAGIALVVFFCYVPGIQTVLGAANVGWIPWVCGPAAGAVLWIYNEGSKFYFRRAKPNDILVRFFAW